ncbi:MAG TPA: hypothetical protein VM915_14280 [Verrucomicrobiae bacterium]|nr:hypothetical protein [Verrucomicrobiae bacterium]
MRRGILVSLLMLGACASAPTRAPLDVDALVADAPAYVAAHYQARELPAALVSDLTTAGFDCVHHATMSECSETHQAFASCFDVSIVRISANEPVYAERNRRCMGARPG